MNSSNNTLATAASPNTLHRLLRHFGPARRMLRALRRGPREGGVPRLADSAAASTGMAPRSALLLATVAHEMRTPLGVIGLAAAQLGRGGADNVAQGQAIIDRQVQRLSRLVEDLLDVEAARTGRLRMALGRVRMCEVVDEALEACRPALARRRQRLVVHALPASDCFIDGDALRLTQIIVNLLDNASKYTPEGGEVGLAVVVTGQTLTATVSDDGIGIAPAMLQQVFGPFVREPRAVRFHGAGLGLGLTVVRDLVAAHGGEVLASSKGVGQGSRFVVKLPLCRNGTGAGTGTGFRA